MCFRSADLDDCIYCILDLSPFAVLHAIIVFGPRVAFFKFVKQSGGGYVLEPSLPSSVEGSSVKKKKRKVQPPIEWWSCDLLTEEGREMFMERMREVAQTGSMEEVK